MHNCWYFSFIYTVTSLWHHALTIPSVWRLARSLPLSCMGAVHSVWRPASQRVARNSAGEGISLAVALNENLPLQCLAPQTPYQRLSGLDASLDCLPLSRLRPSFELFPSLLPSCLPLIRLQLEEETAQGVDEFSSSWIVEAHTDERNASAVRVCHYLARHWGEARNDISTHPATNFFS